jgi:hypothetical protein
MLAVYKTLERKWKFKKPQFRHFKESVWKTPGRIRNHNTRANDILLELFYLIFVDDITFLFESLDEML